MNQSAEYFYYSLLKGNTEYVYKKAVNEGKEQEIFHFTVDDKNKEFFGTNVAISTNEKWLAVSDINGLILFSPINNQTKVLVKNTNECSKSFFSCNKYIHPLFSADNSYLAATKLLYEGAAIEIFDVNTLQTIAKDYPGGIFEWSKAKNNLAISGNGYGTGGVFMAVVPGNKLNNLSNTIKDIENAQAGDIDWYKDQKLVFAYNIGDNLNGNTLQIISYDQTNGSFKTIFDLFNEQGIYQDQVRWLPQGNGIIFKDAKGEVWIIREDGISKAKLPFKADKILQII